MDGLEKSLINLGFVPLCRPHLLPYTRSSVIQLIRSFWKARAHQIVHNEAQDAQQAAEAGYRYKLALDAGIRTYLSANEEQEDFPEVSRFGKLRRPRARRSI